MPTSDSIMCCFIVLRRIEPGFKHVLFEFPQVDVNKQYTVLRNALFSDKQSCDMGSRKD